MVILRHPFRRCTPAFRLSNSLIQGTAHEDVRFQKKISGVSVSHVTGPADRLAGACQCGNAACELAEERRFEFRWDIGTEIALEIFVQPESSEASLSYEV
jgi:hypothetical protein